MFGSDDRGGGDATDVAEYGPAEFRAEAEDFADDEAELDFGFDSLLALDEYAAGQAAVVEALDEEGLGEELPLGELQRAYVLWFGSYFGEVLVRELDGEWVVEEDEAVVEIPTPLGDYEVPVFDAAVAAVRDEPQFASYGADLRDLVEGDAPDDDRDPPETVREAARQSAAELVEFFEEYDLDYSPASLSRLDDLVDDCWSTDRFEEADVGGDGVDDRIYRRLVEQLGSYFGEVLVRSLDGRWAGGEDPFVRDTVVEVPGDPDAGFEDGDVAVVNVFHVAEDCLAEPSKFAMVYGTVSGGIDGD